MKKFLRNTNLDAERFRNGMAQLTGAVNIIATRNGEVRSGLTASAVCSFSAEPPRLLACVNFSGNSFQHIAESRCMSVNVLAQSQEHLAKRFADMLGGKHEDRFNYGKWTELVTGAPVLEEALAGFDCTVKKCWSPYPRGHYRRGEGRDREQRPEAPALLKPGVHHHHGPLRRPAPGLQHVSLVLALSYPEIASPEREINSGETQQGSYDKAGIDAGK